MREVVIASAARLAVGRLGGSLKEAHEEDMGSAVVKEAINRAGVSPDCIDEIIMGQNYRSGQTATNISRVIGIRAGLPLEIPGFSVNMHCSAGLKTVALAAQAIKAEEADILVAGGIDNMSNAAYFLPNMRWGAKAGHKIAQDQIVMLDPVCKLTTGQTAEKLSRMFNISRQEQDEFALWSQQKAEAAIKGGKFVEEIVPLKVPAGRNKFITFDTDEHPRFGTTMEMLSKLSPVFADDDKGTVTAGNSSGLNDSAGATVIMASDKAKEMGIKPLAKIRSYHAVGVDPSIMGIAPVPATREALRKAGLQLDDIELIELNEAFACVGIYWIREMKPKNTDIINVNGGAVALGHPIAATGTVLLTKLLYEMKRRDLQLGLVTMCVGGGQGMAMIVDRDV